MADTFGQQGVPRHPDDQRPASAPAPSTAPLGADPAAGTSGGLEVHEPRSPFRTVGLGTFLVVVLVALLLLVLFFGALRHWFALHTGIINGGPDKYYNFWSGFGSDLGEATLISAVGIGVYTGVRKVNCHTKGCWRIGHHVLAGTPYILCRHHHPGVPTRGASHTHILEAHRRFLTSPAGKSIAPVSPGAPVAPVVTSEPSADRHG